MKAKTIMYWALFGGLAFAAVSAAFTEPEPRVSTVCYQGVTYLRMGSGITAQISRNGAVVQCSGGFGN